MSEQLEIVFTDRAGASTAPQASPSAPGDSQSPSNRTPGPADRVVGPKKPDSQGIGRDLENAAQKIANALGIGGLTGTALELRKAFGRLYESVTASATAVESRRRMDTGGMPAPSEAKSAAAISKPEPVTGPPVPKPGYEDKGFKYDEVTKSIRPMTPAEQDERANRSMPSLGKQGFRYDPVSQRVGIPKVTPPVSGPPAVPGPPVAPPVVGPTAGAGTAASGMARLAAAAGPAAIAVGILAGAIAVGAAAVKKTFDKFAVEADRLSGYSAQLSGATAKSDIRAEFADIRRAQKIGPGLSRVENTTSKAETALTDLGTAVLDQLLKLEEKFDPLIVFSADLIQIIAKTIPPIADTAGKVLPLVSPIALLVDQLPEVINLVRRKLGMPEIKEEDEGVEDPFMEAFLARFAGGMDRGGRAHAIRAAREPEAMRRA